MSERLLRFTRNDNVQCAIKVHGHCHCEGLFRSNLPTFIREIWLQLCCAMQLWLTPRGVAQYRYFPGISPLTGLNMAVRFFYNHVIPSGFFKKLKRYEISIP